MVYNTEQRNILFTFLKNNPDKMFSARQIENELKNENISRSAVYRNLSELESDEKIKRCTKNGSREIFYQFYDNHCCKNHIHLSCTKCGKISHIEASIADNFVSNVENSEGFEINKGETTVYGICRECHHNMQN